LKTVQLLESSLFGTEGGFAEYEISGKKEKRELVECSKEESLLPLPYRFLNPLQSVFYWHYEGGNALVSSPTSSGKSLLTYLFRLKNSHGRLIYTAPTRSLIWEKFKELRGLFGRVGVRSGELIEELSEIREETVVATYESLLSAARNGAKWFEEAGALVVDEVHVLRDEGRGMVVEELVSYALSEGIPLLALSATIPGALELAKWIEAELFVESRWRPVPLERKVLNFRKLLKKRSGEPAEKIVRAVENLELNGKSLIFVPRKDLGWQALEVENALYKRELLNETLPFTPLNSEENAGEAAFHNADVPQEERMKIEKAFKRGSLDRLYATQTLAYGVNLPADNVVIFVRGFFDRLEKRYRLFPDILTILQMEGRAGRFGLSEKGRSYIVVSGAREDALEELLKREMELPFETALSSGIGGREGKACQNSQKALLSLMLLGPLIRYGRRWQEATGRFFSVKRNPLLFRELEKIIAELEELGFLEDGRPTPLTKSLVSSFVSPYCYQQFKERRERAGELLLKEPTTFLLYALRPFIRKEFNPKVLSLFTNRAFDKEALKIASSIEEETELEVRDNSEVLIFYASGSLFPFKNIARPPGELSTLAPESSLLGQLLCKLNLFEFEVAHRAVMSVRSGIPHEFSLLGAIEGLGYMRGNALARAGKLLGSPNEIALINGIREELPEFLEALKEVLSERYGSVKAIERETSAIVNAVNKVKFPLGNERLLKFLASLFVGRSRAITLTKEEALEVLRENVKGEEKGKA